MMHVTTTVDDHYICDSRGVSSCNHKCITPPKQQKNVSFRKFRNIDVCKFEKDLHLQLLLIFVLMTLLTCTMRE